ncbi:methyltransferase domain-containing protein [Chloroflexota bacterium]
MSNEEENTWDKRYSSGDYKPRQEPSDLLTKWLDEFPPGKALDLACGTGRNSLFLAEKGYEVTAIDISPAAIKVAENKALAKGLKINWIVADLDSFKISGQYDVISNFFHVNMKIVPDMINSLNIGGVLIYQHHLFPPLPLSEPLRHPSSFKPGELPQLFKDLKVIHYEEQQVDEEGGRHSYLASLVAKKE